MAPEDLFYLIETHAQDLLDADASDATIRTRLNAAEHVQELDTRVTTATLLDALEQAEYEALRTALESDPSWYVQGIIDALNGPGVLFKDPRSQAFIGSLRPTLGDEATDKLLALGVVRTPVLEANVTAAEVGAARQWKAIDSRIKNAAALAHERIVPGMSDSDQADTWAQAWIDGV